MTIKTNEENFSPKMIGSQLHARIDCNNNLSYISYKPPSAHGEYGCTQLPCPDNMNDNNITCWCCAKYN